MNESNAKVIGIDDKKEKTETSLNLELYPIRLKEVFDDSPMFRKHLLIQEDSIDKKIIQINNFIKLYKNAISTLIQHGYAMSVLATEIALFGKDSLDGPEPKVDDLNYQSSLQTYSQNLLLLENNRSDLCKSIRGECLPQLEFLISEMKEIKESHKKWLKSCSHLDTIVSKLSSVKKKSSKLDNLESDYIEAKKDQTLCAFDVASRLNIIHAKVRLEILGSTSKLLELQNSYFRKDYKITSEVKEFFKKDRADVELEKYLFPQKESSVKAGVCQWISNITTLPSEENGVIQGYLFCKSLKSGGTGKRNYFILNNGLLKFYETIRSDEMLTLVLDTKLCSVRPSIDATKNYCFELISPAESYVLQAESQESMKKWLDAIKLSIELQLSQHSPDPSHENSNPRIHRLSQTPGAIRNNYNNATNPRNFANIKYPRESNKFSNNNNNNNNTTTNSTTNNISNDNENINNYENENRSNASIGKNYESKKFSFYLKDLYECEPDNRVCADCGNSFPTWTSISLGILICLECSGVHRSLGTHISKVRSFTLDKVDNDTIQFIRAFGNKASNEIFEANPINGRISSKSTRREREKWIKSKYCDKAMVAPYEGSDLALDLYNAIKEKNLKRTILLVAQGASINEIYFNDSQKQPIHLAALSSPEILEFLVLNGANVNAHDASGATPLHYAVTDNCINSCILCKNKALIDLVDNKKKTPEKIAMEKQSADNVTLLKLVKFYREYDDEKSLYEALNTFSNDIYFGESLRCKDL